MSKSQTDGFSEADGILSPDQRGRGGETKAQGTGWAGGSQDHSQAGPAPPLSHLRVARTAWAGQGSQCLPLTLSPDVPMPPLLAAVARGFLCVVRALLCPTDPEALPSPCSRWFSILPIRLGGGCSVEP